MYVECKSVWVLFYPKTHIVLHVSKVTNTIMVTPVQTNGLITIIVTVMVKIEHQGKGHCVGLDVKP